MKDFLEVVAAFVASNAPKKWWVTFAISPLDEEPPAFGWRNSKHLVHVLAGPTATRVTVIVDGKDVEIVPASDETFATMLARLETKANVTFRLDRAHVTGSPPKLKRAVRDWLANLRKVARIEG